VGTVVRQDGHRRKFAACFVDLKVWDIIWAIEERGRQNTEPHSSMFGSQVLLKSASTESMLSSRKKPLLTNISAQHTLCFLLWRQQ